MADLKVGGEVDSYCTKCKMELAHTILAIWAGDIKRVRCNTCMGEHAFRRADSSKSKEKSEKTRIAKPKTVVQAKALEKASISSYEQLMADKNRANARRYNIKEKFDLGDLVEHPTFGLGVVAAARGLDKVDVAFQGTVKTLLHNKSATPPVMAKPPTPRLPDAELADEKNAPDPTADTSD